VYLLNLSGIKGKNSFGNSTAIAIKSILLNSTITSSLKVWINAPRPNLEKHAFPSGHTSTAFTFAHFMHREFGERSPWYSVGAYTTAAAVGMMRMGKNVHWLPDVLAGAGVGIFSTELIYLTHQYKWDNHHLKRLDIFPWQQGNQKGLSLVYQF
ncbi:MAG: phosphatase PAP2 family protein, partial [Mariniphaga sp.]